MTDRSQPPPPIRVAVRLPAGPVPAYLAAAADLVMGVTGAEVALLLVADGAARGRSAGRPGRWLTGLYEWLERRALRGGPRALRTAAPPAGPAGVPVVRGGSAPEQAEALRSARVDVLVDLAPDDEAGPAAAPPQGRWRLAFAELPTGTVRPEPVRPESALALVESRLSMELPSGQVLESEAGVSALHRAGFARDRDAVCWRAARLPARRLERLAAGHPVPSTGIDQPERPAPPPPPGEPGGDGAPFRALASVILGKAFDRLRYRSGWCVLVRRGANDPIAPRDLSGFRPIEAPKGRFYADPFVVASAGGSTIYVEDCPDGAHRGRISTLRETAAGDWAPERVVLDDLPHRAYPHVLAMEGELILTPDSGREGGVDLFLDRGPGKGVQPVGRCLEGVAASDPTLLWHEGRYWLFVGVTSHGMSPWDELHLYWAASIDGLWHPHPGNPVVADVRRARPAGRIFRTPGGLIRPGQDCSEAYGRRIVLSEITSLTPDTYAERPVGTIEPVGVPGFSRTHTYAFDGHVQVLDGFRRVPRWRPERARR